MTNNAVDSARLRTMTGLANCALNSSRPTRASPSMVRTMLAIPARVRSRHGSEPAAAWVVAASSVTTESKTAPTNSSLSVKLS